MIKKSAKFLLIFIAIILFIIGGYFLFMTITDYKPEELITLEAENTSTQGPNSTFSVTTFNIGYATLDAKTDFFMDGGTESRAKSEDNVYDNLKGIQSFMSSSDSDIYLLQEVDVKATRSKNINQYEYLTQAFSGYEAIFATNYKVPLVPVPINKPLGAVYSGLTTLTKFQSSSNVRHQFPGSEAWPRQLALLDRCFIESRFPYNDKELIVVNLHMSAYDTGGFMRAQQVAYLQSYLKEAYAEGNYIIVGGDFNHEIPGTDSDNFNTVAKPSWLKLMDADFPGFTWYNDPAMPTNRSLDKSFVKGENYVANIDGFLVSDNITVTNTIVHDLNFDNSDHNPVSIECVLND